MCPFSASEESKMAIDVQDSVSELGAPTPRPKAYSILDMNHVQRLYKRTGYLNK